MKKHFLSLAVITLSTMSASAITDEDLRAALEQRFKGDRTGACVAAAVIENGATAYAYVCADVKSDRPFDEHTAFEVGSVSKTMTAALLALLIGRGEIALEDPIAKLLPPGTIVPSFNGSQITVATNIEPANVSSPMMKMMFGLCPAFWPGCCCACTEIVRPLATTRRALRLARRPILVNRAPLVLALVFRHRRGS